MTKTIMTAFFCAIPLFAYASLSDEEVKAGICILANQGVHTVATERQAGTPKPQVKSLLDKQAQELSQKFSSPNFVSSVGQVWHEVLEDIYALPVLPSQSEKEAFVSDITQEAFLSCMSAL